MDTRPDCHCLVLVSWIPDCLSLMIINEDIINEDINKLVEWVNKWQMSFNVDKIMFCDAHRTQQHEKQL